MKKRVLIVDDEFGLADVVAEMLTENGYDVSLAINGRYGLDAVAKFKPHLVLLDVMMPVLDGIGMLEQLRSNPEHAALPVILMTALPKSPAPGVAPLYQAILHKPFTPTLLFDTIRSLIGDAE